MLRKVLRWLAAALLGAAFFAPRAGDAGGEFQPEVLPLPGEPGDYRPVAKHYEAMKIPSENPLTKEKAALGRQLFFDARLSGDGKLSCYSCHVNEHGLTDGKALAEGAFGKKLTRTSPTLWNIGYHAELYWDGRAKGLEPQAKAAWTGVNMGASKPEEIVAKLNALPGYRAQFEKVFGGEAKVDDVPKALAAYMRTIVSRTTPFDKWQAGDESAVSDAAKRGHQVFEKAKCTNCHAGVLLTNRLFHNVGIGMDKPSPDVGRFKVTNAETDKGAFKTPTLRDVARSAPYFHDGSVATLEEAVKLMVGGGIDNPSIDKVNLKKADLTDAELKDLIEFLKSLDETATLDAPPLPPTPSCKACTSEGKACAGCAPRK